MLPVACLLVAPPSISAITRPSSLEWWNFGCLGDVLNVLMQHGFYCKTNPSKRVHLSLLNRSALLVWPGIKVEWTRWRQNVWVPWKCSAVFAFSFTRGRNPEIVDTKGNSMHFMPSTLTKIPVDLCVGPTTTPPKTSFSPINHHFFWEGKEKNILQRWNPLPGFLWSHAATQRGPKWGTALGYAVLLQALEEAARSRRYGGEIFCWIWGLRFHGRIWGVEGSGRIQIIVYQFLAILISLKLERLKKLDEIHRIIQESQWETWLNILI